METVLSRHGDEVNLAREHRFEEIEDAMAWALDTMRDDDRRWIMVIELVDDPSRYVQVLAPGAGGLWAECVSNEFLAGESRLSEDQCEVLPLLGWEWPGPPSSPNWHFHDQLLDTGTAIAGLLLRTLRRVLEVAPDDLLTVRLIRKTEPELLGDQR